MSKHGPNDPMEDDDEEGAPELDSWGEGRKCDHCFRLTVFYCPQSGENVCRNCGYCPPDRVCDSTRTYRDTFGSPKPYYVRKRKGVDHSRLLGPAKGEYGKYDRRYYWNERFRQWSNQCPLVPIDDLQLIASPLYLRQDSKVMRPLFKKPEYTLSRSDIAAMCKSAKLSKHAEKWIQIKWRLSNFPPYSPAPLERPIDNFRKEWMWQPSFITEHIHQRLYSFANLLHESFLRIQAALDQLPYLLRYRRKSFLNFDFIMMRGLYMLCPECDPELHDKQDICWVRKYAWALKSLRTGKNLMEHVTWFYFLVAEMIGRASFDGGIRDFCDWSICPADSVLLLYRPKPDPTCPTCQSTSDDGTLSPATLGTLSRRPIPLGVYSRLPSPLDSRTLMRRQA